MCTVRPFYGYTGTRCVQSHVTAGFTKPFSSEYMNTHKYNIITSNLPTILYPEIISEQNCSGFEREKK